MRLKIFFFLSQAICSASVGFNSSLYQQKCFGRVSLPPRLSALGREPHPDVVHCSWGTMEGIAGWMAASRGRCSGRMSSDDSYGTLNLPNKTFQSVARRSGRRWRNDGLGHMDVHVCYPLVECRPRIWNGSLQVPSESSPVSMQAAKPAGTLDCQCHGGQPDEASKWECMNAGMNAVDRRWKRVRESEKGLGQNVGKERS